MTKAVLEVDKLVVQYGQIVAVQGVDLTVNEKELVTVIGANGAGKTSTLNAICLLYTSPSPRDS